MKIKVKAKLNLILRVMNKREDNYHNLEMINTKINLYDKISIKTNSTKDIIKYIYHPEYDTTANNLILKVLTAFKQKYNIKTNYLIKIKKQIPFGAGLGGASMDAGEIIKAISKKEKIEVEQLELIDFLKQFGADIPYSLYDSTCLVENIGDKITPIKIGPKEFILICPNIYIDTAMVFKEYDLQPTKHRTTDILKDLNNETYYNDLQETAYICEPRLKELVLKLSTYGNVIMSGSGSSLIIDTKQNKKKLVSTLKKDYPLYIIKIIKIPN